MNIIQLASKKGNYGNARSADKIKYICVHYTGNKTDKASSNAKYFANNVVKASAHYFVDANEIYQSVPDLVTAWSVGGTKYNDCATTGGGSMYNKITNTNSISVELCSTNGAFEEATLNNAAELIKSLMTKYNIPAENVYRHSDVNGKHCPAWAGWLGSDSSKWIAFKNKLSGSKAAETKTIETKVVNEGYTYYVVTAKSGLNIRAAASTSAAKVGVLAYNTKVAISKISGKWGYISDKGWICLDYAKKYL